VEDSLSRSDQTREKILDAAEGLFTQKGFTAVGVREITGQAQVHLSAVNYYFGSKKNLYLEVFRARVLPRTLPFQSVLEKLEQEEEIDLEVLIRTMASAFLRGGIGPQPDLIRHGPLFFRELTNPSEAFDILVTEFFKPIHQRLSRILARGLKREVAPERLSFYSMTLMALVRHFIHSQELVRRILEKDFDDEYIGRMIDYLTDFVMHGLAMEESP